MVYVWFTMFINWLTGLPDLASMPIQSAGASDQKGEAVFG